MVTALLLIALSYLPEPAGFSFELRAGTPVTVTVDGVEVKPGVVYLTEPGTYKVTVRYHGPDDEYVTEEFELKLTRGKVRKFTLGIPAPPTAII